jgi:hypothetical protein
MKSAVVITSGVIPAEAGTHERLLEQLLAGHCSWIPAFAGMTQGAAQ